ncbi:MAG: pantetheine-phosphate adenylyltransferase [Nocardioidaceae bacterium]|nr:pantetheine-phosphate adenylyltransferase [Nocardioidaceae bacterium]
MRRAVCPGSFDPMTNGHLDIIGRAAALFDEVYVAVLVNEAKQALFGADERITMLQQATATMGHVRVASFGGLLVDFCTERSVDTIVKGVRDSGELGYELQMAQMNRALSGVETVLLPTAPQWSFVSSSLVKEVARLGGDVEQLVPPYVLDRLRQRSPDRPDESI